MGNKLWLMQHDELKKGGIISMFIHLFKEMCGFASMCVCVCLCSTSPNPHSVSSPFFSFVGCLLGFSVCVCVFLCSTCVHM